MKWENIHIRDSWRTQKNNGCIEGEAYREKKKEEEKEKLKGIAYRYGEGNGTPLQYSCLENPMIGGAW